MLSPDRWLWIGGIALILSFALPVVSDGRSGLELEWAWETWQPATYAILFARLLPAVLGLVALAFIRPLNTSRRGAALFAVTVLFAAWHFVAGDTPVNLWMRFDAGVRIGTHTHLGAYLLVGISTVVAGQALPTRGMLMFGGLWLLAGYAIPHRGGEPLAVAFFESDWRDAWHPLVCLATLASIAVAALFGLHSLVRWLLLGLAVAGPVLFVWNLDVHQSRIDLWFASTVTLRGVCLYYGFVMLSAAGLVAARGGALNRP